MELVFLDHEGNLVSKLPVLERNGSFSADEDVTFSLPSNVTRVFLAFSYLTPQENMSAFEVASFNLSRVFYEKHGEMLNSSFYIGDEGDYDVHVRVLKSQSAGEMRLYLDGDPMSRVMTKGDVNTFHWERVYSGPLSEGEHVVSVEQLGGSNVVNIGYVERSGGQRPDLSGKTIIYRLTGKNDFFGDSFQVVGNKGSSTFHCAMTEGPLLSNIEVFEDGNYDLSYSLEGEATVFVDGQEAGGQVYLEKGLRKIEVRPSGSAICLDHVTLIRGLPPREQEARLLDFRRLDPSTYSVLVNSSTPFLFSFSRAYDPLWVASVGGDSYSPVSSYGVINAFRVNRTGVNEIIVEYAPQKSFYAGIIIGIIGISSAIAYVRRSEP
jgi:hypothetical protein